MVKDGSTVANNCSLFRAFCSYTNLNSTAKIRYKMPSQTTSLLTNILRQEHQQKNNQEACWETYADVIIVDKEGNWSA
jgi:hypothetical protein